VSLPHRAKADKYRSSWYDCFAIIILCILNWLDSQSSRDNVGVHL
jgi:hypothetical protein